MTARGPRQTALMLEKPDQKWGSVRQKFSPAHLTPLTERASPKDVWKESASPRSILLLDARCGARVPLGFRSLLPGRASDWRRQRRAWPKAERESNRLPGTPPRPGSGGRKQLREAVRHQLHRASPQPLPLAQVQQRGVSWARREEKPVPGCFPKAPGHTQPYGGAEWGPTWKMIGTVPTEEHPRRIQHASSETSVENVKVCGYILLFKI